MPPAPTPTGEAEGDQVRNIGGVGDLPTLRLVLSHGAKPAVDLRRSFAEEADHLVAVEAANGRCLVIVDEVWQARARPAIAWLRGQLRAQGRDVEPMLHSAASDLIEQLLQQGRSQKASSLDVAGNEGIKLFRKWLDMAIDARAQDLHLDVLQDRGLALMRVSTEIIPVPGRERGIFSAQQVAAAIADSYGLLRSSGSGQRTEFHRDAGAYAMLPSDKLERPYRVRFQYTPTLAGGSASLRLLPEASVSIVRSFEQAGWAPEGHVDELEMAVRSGKGGTIFAGKTGSGKTTSLNLIFRTLIDPNEFVCWEYGDPIEIPHPAIRQVSAKREVDGSSTKGGDPFKIFSAEIKRQDPDYINIGEIRDEESVSLFEGTVLSGAACLGTIHASSIRGIPDRLSIDGMARDKMANPDLLRTLVYMELLPVLCQHCKLPAVDFLKEKAGDTEEGQRLKREQRRVEQLLRIADEQCGVERERLFLRNMSGCSHCRHRGVAGVTNALELYRPTREWFDAVRKGDDERAFQVFRSGSDGNLVSGNQHGKTVIQHALLKAWEGRMDIRVVEQLGDFDRYQMLLGEKAGGSKA